MFLSDVYIRDNSVVLCLISVVWRCDNNPDDLRNASGLFSFWLMYTDDRWQTGSGVILREVVNFKIKHLK